MEIPCQQCAGCRLERARQWAVRSIHESRLHRQNCVVTLTYDQDREPPFGSLHYPDFQLFMKRARKYFAPNLLRFYMGGEYGELYGRPHYHAALFGVDFPDRKPWKKTAGGVIDRSAILEQLWPHGFSSVMPCNWETVGYIARYVMKKITGDAAADHYRVVDLSTGEIGYRTPEFNKMSLKPGIGADWFRLYRTDVFPHDRVVINGKEVKPPKYYDKLFAKDFPDVFEDIQWAREIEGLSLRQDNTTARLAVKEQIALANLSKLKRGLQ